MSEGYQHPPLSLVALIFAGLSVPLAFARHLVSLALVLGILALICAGIGHLLQRRRPDRYGTVGSQRLKWAFRLGGLGSTCAVLIWILWRQGVLPL